MTESVAILKDENEERPIPTLWRNTLAEIVEAFKNGDFKLECGVAGVQPISDEEATRIAGNIDAYGNQLTSLPDDSWRTSVHRWMREYWEVLVDLFTVDEGESDLVMFVRVYEDGSAYRFEVQSVHVP